MIDVKRRIGKIFQIPSPIFLKSTAGYLHSQNSKRNDQNWKDISSNHVKPRDLRSFFVHNGLMQFFPFWGQHSSKKGGNGCSYVDLGQHLIFKLLTLYLYLKFLASTFTSSSRPLRSVAPAAASCVGLRLTNYLQLLPITSFIPLLVCTTLNGDNFLLVNLGTWVRCKNFERLFFSFLSMETNDPSGELSEGHKVLLKC